MFSRDEIKNLILAVLISAVILILWQTPVEVEDVAVKEVVAVETQPKTVFISREEALEKPDRIAINNAKLTGSISLKGLRFDDLLLAKYRKKIEKDSGEVELLSPSETKSAYFAEFGWIGNTELPNKNTLWNADKSSISANETTTFSWINNVGVLFEIAVSLDENYMFTITQNVANNSGKDIELFPYGLLSKNIAFDFEDSDDSRSGHKGFVGVFEGGLNELTYEDLREDEQGSFNDKNGWFGFADKYWFTAIIPQRNSDFVAKTSYVKKDEFDKYQADFMGEKTAVTAGGSMKTVSYFYAGAKEVKAIDEYSEKLNIPLFDRSIDFGWFYFIAKPMFLVLHMIYSSVGNLGVAIILLTFGIKLLLFPIANASYKSMNKMKKLQPEIKKLQERMGKDKLKQNTEMMKLYKKHKVNPAAGCIPLLVQIPIFFSLFKVLSISIEVRHAPFFGWIKDLSAPDPTSVFNLFTLIPWEPPQLLNIGVLPILWCISMIIQQKFNPKPADPVQEKVMKAMPYFFLILFSSFPAGLVVYWTFSNLITILQQYLIKRKN